MEQSFEQKGGTPMPSFFSSSKKACSAFSRHCSHLQTMQLMYHMMTYLYVEVHVQ